MLSQRDMAIIKHANDYGITVNQCYKIFISHAKFGLDMARKRLKVLYDRGLLKRGKSWDTGRMVYYVNKMPSTHDVLLMDFYAELKSKGADVIEFVKEFSTEGLRADGIVHFNYKGSEVVQFLEVILTHKVNYKKYEDLKDKGIFQKEYGIFPPLVVIDANPRIYEGNKLDVIYIDHDMNEFDLKVLP